MESNLTLVNDREAQRVLLAAAPIVDHQIRGGSKVFPHGGCLLGSLDGLAIDARDGVPGTKVERCEGRLSGKQAHDSEADEATLVESRLGFDIL